MMDTGKCRIGFLLWTLFASGILAVLWQLSSQAMNPDTAWLMTGALRLLDGGTMARDIYETNPPLSILIHVPPALLTKFTGMSVYNSSFIFFNLIQFAAAFAVWRILRPWPFLGADARSLIVAGFFTASAVMSWVSFGERDHLIACWLLPFVLIQYAMNEKLPVSPRLKWAVFVVGTVFILLKPPHGLIPALMILWRMIRERRLFSIMRDSDFICLSAGVALYAALTWIFFRDYITVILPDVLSLYLPHAVSSVPAKTVAYAALTVTIIIVTAALPLEKNIMRLTECFFAAALLSLIPYVVQMKGYHYHLIPAIMFGMCGICLGFGNLFAQTAVLRKTPAAAIALAALAFALAAFPPAVKMPRNSDYQNFEITRLVQNCGADCDSFFMFNDTMGILSNTALYTGKRHASRFPTLWFLPSLAQGKNPALSRKYADMLAEDMTRFNPGLLLIGLFTIDGMDDAPFDFPAFFSISPAFRQEWAQYEKTGSIKINRGEYYRGTNMGKDFFITYDIYRRKTNRL